MLGLLYLKRNYFDIIEDILELLRKKRQKNRILHHVNLSFKQLQEYLGLLLEINLLTSDKNDGKAFYKITEKGFSFLDKYQEIQNL